MSKITFNEQQKNEINSLYDRGSTIKEIALLYNVEKRNISKLLKGKTRDGYFVAIPMIEVFKQNSKYARSNLRARVLKEGVVYNACALCNLKDIWNEAPITLQIDHINGDGFDNGIDNLRFLCANCHSQTDTFASRNFSKYKKEIMSLNRQALEDAVKSSISYSNVCRNISAKVDSNSTTNIKALIKLYDINTSHFKYKSHIERKVISDEDLFCQNSKHHSSTIKARILKKELLTNKCSFCGLEHIYNNKALVLQIDHINGINNDNRLENLRMLCPNCHSQTPTFMLGTRKSKK